jgi:hypothetical protein
MSRISVGTAPEPGHLQCINDQNRSGDAALQKQPAELMTGILAAAVTIRRGHRKVAIQQVGCDRQAVSAVGCGDPEASPAAGADIVLLHELLHTLLADADALSMQFAPDTRPAVSSAVGDSGPDLRRSV